jgi:hypothetical protein
VIVLMLAIGMAASIWMKPGESAHGADRRAD